MSSQGNASPGLDGSRYGRDALEFFAYDMHAGRRIDPEADLTIFEGNDADDNVVVDHDSLTRSAGEDKHVCTSLHIKVA